MGDPQPSSKDTSPSLALASKSRAAFFIRWRFCWESATAASLSLGNTFFCWSSSTNQSQDAQNSKTRLILLPRCVSEMPLPSLRGRWWVYRFICWYVYLWRKPTEHKTNLSTSHVYFNSLSHIFLSELRLVSYFQEAPFLLGIYSLTKCRVWPMLHTFLAETMPLKCKCISWPEQCRMFSVWSCILDNSHTVYDTGVIL